MKLKRKIVFCLFGLAIAFGQASGQSFIHPGMLQSREDLDCLKQKIASGEQPWKKAFENLKKETSLAFKPEPFTHVSVGPYGTNNVGSKEFHENGKSAYNQALVWYITGDKKYAARAIETLNAWSRRLWDFDANNAKLTVGLSAPYFLNAAEILRYSDAGWEEKDIEQFSIMVSTVFYPTIRDFFPEANGNWDASLIYAMLCMGVFLDNHEMFDRAVDRFKQSTGNSGIVRYIYPTGQCQETPRDWDHIQLGIGEYAKAAQTAWTQKTDLYRFADNRLALGFEYAARFLSGEDIPVFGFLSQNGKEVFRDIYESIYLHYTTVKGIEMPYTGKIIETHTRANSSIGVLTALRAPGKEATVTNRSSLRPHPKAKMPASTGALDKPAAATPPEAIVIQPGESIQEAIDKNKGKAKWIVLAKGIHTLQQPLKIESNLTLAGMGKESILFLSPEVHDITLVNASNEMQNVTIRDLLIEGADRIGPYFDPNQERIHRSYMNAPSRGGILFSADHENQIKNIRLENLTVRHCTKNGVSLRGVSGIKIVNCDFSDNGSSVVPGPGFHHNLHLSHVKDCEITGSRLDDSLWGSGIDLSWGENVIVSDNEMARNKRSGIKYTESKNVSLTRNLMEGNEEPATGNNHAMHPEEQLDFVERQIKAQNEPYYAAYLQLIHFADSLLAIPHHALVDFAVPGFYDKPEEHRSNSLAIQCDAFGAYCSALAYRLSGEKKYGEKACYFLNAWANTNKRYSEHDGVLVMTYSGSALLIAAELMSGTKLWEKEDKKAFEQWVSSVYQKAANEIRVHKNNWADWGRFGSLLAASFLDDREEIAENVRLIQSDLFDKIAPDGSMPEETRRGNNGIWYTYFSLAPMTAACWLAYNLTGEDLFVLEKNNISIKKALNYLAYYNQHPDKWPWHAQPNTGKGDVWPENLLEAMAGIYPDENYEECVKGNRPIIYAKHHFAWSFPSLVPLSWK